MSAEGARQEAVSAAVAARKQASRSSHAAALLRRAVDARAREACIWKEAAHRLGAQVRAARAAAEAGGRNSMHAMEAAKATGRQVLLSVRRVGEGQEAMLDGLAAATASMIRARTFVKDARASSEAATRAVLDSKSAAGFAAEAAIRAAVAAAGRASEGVDVMTAAARAESRCIALRGLGVAPSVGTSTRVPCAGNAVGKDASGGASSAVSVRLFALRHELEAVRASAE